MKKKPIIVLTLIGIIFLITCVCINQKKIYFSLKGKEYIKIDFSDTYKEKGYEALYCSKYAKIFCKDISKKVKISKNIKSNDRYIINYSLEYKGNKKVLTREVIRTDKTNPTIELVENNDFECPNTKFKESGYKAFDNVDGEITDKVKVQEKDDKVYYTVMDSSGNKKIVYRKRHFKDTEAPKIEIGSDIKYIYLNQKYVDNDFIAIDNCDGDITSNVKVVSNVNTSKTGEYEVKYSVSDMSGNKSIEVKKVIVYDDNSKIPKNGKIVYLTFDDGPSSYTEEILKILDKYNVKVTFFVTNQFSTYQHLLKNEHKKGHTVAIHTYSHNYEKIYSSLDSYLLDFNNMNQVIYEQTGTYAKLFRFPGGSSNTISNFNKGIMSLLSYKMTELGYIYFDWNVDSQDTVYDDPNIIANSVISEIGKRNESVVLMHDTKKVNLSSLEIILNYGIANGYTFLPLDENTPVVHHSINN